MFDSIQALALVFLEMLFIFVSLGVLHSQRSAIGKAPFYLAIGLLMLFCHLVNAAECRVELLPGTSFDLAMVTFHLPLLAAFMMVYIADGTLEAQRLLIGSVVLYGLYLYLCEVTRIACNWPGVALSSGIPADALDLLLGRSRLSMLAYGILHCLDCLVMPAVYTLLNGKGKPNFSALFCAFLSAYILALGMRMLPPEWFGNMPPQWDGQVIAQPAAALVLALLLWIYFSRIEKDIESGERGSLDLFFAFFGGYGRSKELESNLREWTDRYQLVLRSAGELILMLTPGGRVLDANKAAEKLLENPENDGLNGMMLYSRLKLSGASDFIPGGVPVHPVKFNAEIEGSDQRKHLLSCSLSPFRVRSRGLLVLIARDITEEVRLAAEKAKLAEQLVHSQRIEALGMLAGGIAHDFNNHVHAILGHVDVITLLHPPEDPAVIEHLNKIAAIAEQGGKLTSQLLGFARKGKYQVTALNIREVIEECFELVSPQRHRGVEMFSDCPAEMPPFRGDRIQLKQVLLNLILNAIDAMEKNSGNRILKLRVSRAVAAAVPAQMPESFAGKRSLDDFGCIAVADNGCGMTGEVKKKLFEPFFTTKAVGRGTGMGLAMVYGTVANHQGWVQVTSEPGQGSCFYLFLPLAVEEKNG